MPVAATLDFDRKGLGEPSMDIAIRVCAGIAGAVVFSVLNSFILTLSGPHWWLANGAIFVAAFLIAWLIQRQIARNGSLPEQIVGARNESAGKMDINVQGPAPSGAKQTIGSENKSGKDMSVTVKK
jgi:hypothetical protein